MTHPMNPTIEQLAKEHARNIVAGSIPWRGRDLTGPVEQWPRDARADHQSYVEILLRFLSAVHAGPLKGVGEALDIAHKRATAHRLDDYYATGGQSDNDYEAQLKTSDALAILQSLQQPTGEGRK